MRTHVIISGCQKRLRMPRPISTSWPRPRMHWSKAPRSACSRSAWFHRGLRRNSPSARSRCALPAPMGLPPGANQRLDASPHPGHRQSARLSAVRSEDRSVRGPPDRTGKATGFFRVKQSANRWSFADPEGHPCLIPGLSNVGQELVGSAAAEQWAAKNFGSVEAWARQTGETLAATGFRCVSSDGKAAPEPRVAKLLADSGHRVPYSSPGSCFRNSAAAWDLAVGR